MANHRFNDQTYYEILEIRPGASQHEIHSAYQKARTAYSPESPALYTMFTTEEARELLGLIEEAFETLSNQARRKEYDQKLRNSQKNPGMNGELPDFDPADVEDVKRSREVHKPTRSGQPRPASNEKLPEGFGKTRFSIYEIKPDFEAELENSENFDGELLLKARTYKKINLEQMSTETRISKTYLSAVEGNDFKSLPAAVFVRGFVVQMARILGLDEKRVADSYMKLFRTHRSD